MQPCSVSVALPVKNGLPYLRAAMDGLCRQTYPSFQVFVQDSVSTDGSLEYLRSLRTPFPIHIVSEPDGSLVIGYSRAIKRCTGDLVVAAACDEVLDDDAIRKYVQWYEENPDAVFICSGVRLDNGRGGPLQAYQPKPFDLIDYLRHRICPTTAGAFNRRLLGDELRLDESLKTVPDFELITRLALRFGAERIVCKQEITATARADEASRTFRPSIYSQIARDKTTTVNRLLSDPDDGQQASGRISRDFLKFLKRDILCNMHAYFARHIEDIAGDCPEFREQVWGAYEQMPGDPRIAVLASRSRHFDFDRRSHALSLRSMVPPIRPPDGCVVVHASMPADLMFVEPGWAMAGASQDVRRETVQITTSSDPWNYAAWARLDSVDLPLDTAWHWVRVSVLQVSGHPLLSLYDPASNEITREMELAASSEPADYYFELRDDAFRTMLLRNGSVAQPSSVVIRGFEIVSMPMTAQYAA